MPRFPHDDEASGFVNAMPRRRAMLLTGAALAMPALAATADGFERALRNTARSGGVLMFRHALAPGTFDPPGFRLEDCATQRNLDDEGRRQARRIGAWFRAHHWQPTRVRSSPWCRCMETAKLAFDVEAEAWTPLGSPRAGSEEVNAQSLAELRRALATAVQQRKGCEVWVTHMFIFSAWLGIGAQSGEEVLLGVDDEGSPRVVGRLAAAPA
jgi:Histidine phosphatase superfamily (branch 1)